MKYSAFISYRHGGVDEFTAKNMQKMMENYRIPEPMAKKLGTRKVGRIFRDTDELPTSGSLYANIEEALQQTEYLIVICTPRLKESRWCMREIELFIELRGADHVLAVLAEGEPADSFPEALLYRDVDGQRIEVEPLAADVRADSDHGRKQKIKIERLRLLAAILGCDFDQLRQRSRRRQMQQRIAAGTVAAAVVLLFLGMMTRENLKLQAEVSRTQEAQSYLLSQYSQKQYQGDDRTAAALLALEGLPEDLGSSRPLVSASLSALTDALQIYDYQQGYIADRTVSTKTLDSVSISQDGRWLAYTDLTDSETYNTHFYDIQSGAVKGDFPTDADYCPYGSSKAKASFFGENRCAVAGRDGVIVIDTDTMEVLWTGCPATMVEVSADGSVIAACDYRTGSSSFYTADGTLLSTVVLDADMCVPFGLSEDGSLFVLNQIKGDGNDTVTFLDTKTGNTKKQLDQDSDYFVCMYQSSWVDGTFSFLYTNAEQKTGYIWYDLKSDEFHYTDYSVVNLVLHVDVPNGIFYTSHGNQLEQVDMTSGEVKESYSAAGNIAAARYCGDGKWEIVCTDGALEYIDFTTLPYCISRTEGNGVGCTDLKIGGTYMATFLTNTYKVNLYKLNEKTAEKKSELARRAEESCVYVTRAGRLLGLNTTDNSYTVDMDTLKVQWYPSPISFLALGNERSVLLDELDGTCTVFDADTAEKKSVVPSDNTLVELGCFVLDADAHLLRQYDYDTGEVAAEYTVPDTCINAVFTCGKLVCDCVDGEQETVEIFDENQKKIFSDQASLVELSEDYVRYVTADSSENVIYDLEQEKEILRQDFGMVDWSMGTDDKQYIFVSTTDQGGYFIDRSTGSVVLTLSDVSTLYNMMSWEGSPYFALLYISESGSTRLDLYLKAHPDSPVAEIDGGLGINRNDEVIVNDGESYIYAVPMVSKEEVYQAGREFTGSQTLTDRQRQEYHCE